MGKPGRKTRRQIDYITIYAKYMNAAQKAHRHIYWHANMAKYQQHRVQAMHLYYNAGNKYKTPTPQDTGGGLKYDLRELRLHPEKRQAVPKTRKGTRGKQEENTMKNTHNKTNGQEHTNNIMQSWLNYKTQLGKALTRIYPLSKTQKNPEEPEWVTKREQWGTEQEIRQLGNAYKKELHCRKKFQDTTRR